MINVINAGQIPLIAAYGEPKREVPQATWKTHALVVLSGILVAIGIILAIGSFYTSTIIHPMLAVSVPSVPFVAGIALKQVATGHSLVFASFENVETPLNGIHRLGMNCWVNAALQVVFNTPAFQNRIHFMADSPLTEAFNQYQRGEPVDSQKIREWLSQENRSISSDCREMGMANDLIEMCYAKSRSSEPQVYCNRIHENGVVKKSSNRLEVLTLYEVETLKSFQKAFDHEFEGLLRDQSFVTNAFHEIPDDFSINLGEVGYTSGWERNYDVPLKLTCSYEIQGLDATYDCDAFTLYSSNHWTAVVKVDGKWWHANDRQVSQLSDEEALQKLQKASLIHFQKT